MLLVLCQWIYIFLVTFCAGFFIRRYFYYSIKQEKWTAGGLLCEPASLVMTGAGALTVFTEIWSLFFPVGPICHLVLLLFIFGTIFLQKKPFASFLLSLRAEFRNLPMRTTALACLLLLAVAFATSRGIFHTDTNIYHAQTIRLYEAYGTVKGIANIQLHFGYNSAYLALCALFSMGFFPGGPFHTVTGFLAAVLLLYTVFPLLSFRRHRTHYADFLRISVILYIYTNYAGLMSPATDYGTLLFAGYVLLRYAEVMEQRAERLLSSEDAVTVVAALSVLSLIVVSMKLSVASLVLLAAYPVVHWVREKRFSRILYFLALGLFSFLPFLIRNFLISGWLFYPFEAIDLFFVPWKVPVEYSLVDSGQIKAWGRCLYDITLLDMPFFSWVRIWWSEQFEYSRALVVATFLSGLVLLILHALKILRKKTASSFPWLLLFFVLSLGLLLWLFSAPFIRYGLIFLLALPALALAALHEEKTPLFWPFLLLICLLFFVWVHHYGGDNLRFVQSNAAEPYYLAQKPYDDCPSTEIDVGGITVYCPEGAVEINSYFRTPSTCYRFMAERSMPLGETIKDGFAPR